MKASRRPAHGLVKAATPQACRGNGRCYTDVMTRGADDDLFPWRVEEACANAYPAWREVLLDGWMLRAAGGASRRINALSPLGPLAADPARIMGEAAAIYGRLGMPVRFRVPSLLPAAAETLDRHGFTADGTVLTLMREALPRSGPDAVDIQADPHQGWFAAWAACRPEADAPTMTAFRQAVDGLAVPAAFLIRHVEGQAAAVAYVAAHRGIAVLEAVVTHPAQRRRGHGQALVDAAAYWAARAGALSLCLQVTAENAPARSLYNGLGFRRELYRYDYWTAPHPTG